MNPTINLSHINVESPLWHKHNYDRSPLPPTNAFAFPQESLNQRIGFNEYQRQYVKLSTFSVHNIDSQLAFLPGIINVFHSILGLEIRNSSESAISVETDLFGNEDDNNPIFLTDNPHYRAELRLKLGRPILLKPNESTRFFINSNFFNQSNIGTSLTLTIKSPGNLQNVVEVKNTSFIGSHTSEAINKLFNDIKGSHLERTYFNTCPGQNSIPNQIKPIQDPKDLLKIFGGTTNEPPRLQPIVDPTALANIFREPSRVNELRNKAIIDLRTP